MTKCWAACLGDCSDQQSGEHIVTKGTFSTDKVYVQGFPWCLDAPKEIGLASAVKNVLCKEHNTRLSPLDDAVIQVFVALREAVRLTNVRNQLHEKRWTKVSFDIDGRKLERWCLKTLITLSVGGSVPLGPKSKDADTPGENLIRASFGLVPFQAPNGLYVSWGVGDRMEMQDEKVIIGTFSDGNCLAGARFYLGGFIFILYVNEREMKPGPLRFTHKDGHVEERPQPRYHIKATDFKVGKHVSHSVRFLW